MQVNHGYTHGTLSVGGLATPTTPANGWVVDKAMWLTLFNLLLSLDKLMYFILVLTKAYSYQY